MSRAVRQHTSGRHAGERSQREGLQAAAPPQFCGGSDGPIGVKSCWSGTRPSSGAFPLTTMEARMKKSRLMQMAATMFLSACGAAASAQESLESCTSAKEKLTSPLQRTSTTPAERLQLAKLNMACAERDRTNRLADAVNKSRATGQDAANAQLLADSVSSGGPVGRPAPVRQGPGRCELRRNDVWRRHRLLSGKGPYR